MEYLGLWVTHEDVNPKANQIEAIVYMANPINIKEVRIFIGMIN